MLFDYNCSRDLRLHDSSGCLSGRLLSSPMAIIVNSSFLSCHYHPPIPLVPINPLGLLLSCYDHGLARHAGHKSLSMFCRFWLLLQESLGNPESSGLATSQLRSLGFYTYVQRVPPVNLAVTEELPSKWKSALPSSRFLSPIHGS